MRILLDENFPIELERHFPGHDCVHVATLGWKGTKNGELLARAESAGFHMLLTFDADIPKDHDIKGGPLAVYVIQPEGQGARATRALLGEITEALSTWHAGQVLVISNRNRKRAN